MNLPFNFMATAIGSFPHADADRAIDIVLDAIPDAPVWPQLPKTSVLEQMEIQYSGGIPRTVVDRDKGRLSIDTSGDYSEDFAKFYEEYLSESESGSADCSFAVISPEYSRGIYAFEKRIKSSGKRYPFIKVQTTGPCSFALTTVDEKKRAIYYNEEFRDVIVKALAMKSRWQIKKFSPFADAIICFIDEPILSAFGSSTYIGVKRDDVVALVREVADAVKAEKAYAGVHCCGNTDWSILVDAGVDIINFDAYGYGETIALYPQAMKKFIAAGGVLAWGLVPTSPSIHDIALAQLAGLFEKLLKNLSQKAGIDEESIIRNSIITPSCGTGSLQIADSEKVFAVLKELAAAFREKYS